MLHVTADTPPILGENNESAKHILAIQELFIYRYKVIEQGLISIRLWFELVPNLSCQLARPFAWQKQCQTVNNNSL